jgi:hypothetical protein
MREQTEAILVKPRTAAAMLDCSVSKVYELIKRGVLTEVPFDSDKRLDAAQVRRLAATGVRKDNS